MEGELKKMALKLPLYPQKQVLLPPLTPHKIFFIFSNINHTLITIT